MSLKAIPGFIRFLGSSARLICFITSTPPGPISSSISLSLPRPIPCSPVHVPPAAMARLSAQTKQFLSASKGAFTYVYSAITRFLGFNPTYFKSAELKKDWGRGGIVTPHFSHIPALYSFENIGRGEGRGCSAVIG